MYELKKKKILCILSYIFYLIRELMVISVILLFYLNQEMNGNISKLLTPPHPKHSQN